MNVLTVTPERLERLRRICLAFPEAAEKVAWGDPTWRIRDRIFAMQKGNYEGGRPSLWLKAPDGAQAVLVESDPRVFFVPPYVGHKGWVGVYLDATKLDWSVVGHLIEESYRAIAPRQLIEQHLGPSPELEIRRSKARAAGRRQPAPAANDREKPASRSKRRTPATGQPASTPVSKRARKKRSAASTAEPVRAGKRRRTAKSVRTAKTLRAPKAPARRETPDSDMARLQRPVAAMPAFVQRALRERGLGAAYRARPAYQRNDYLGWITRAKREPTRQKRLEQMLAELEGGRLYMNMAWRPARQP